MGVGARLCKGGRRSIDAKTERKEEGGGRGGISEEGAQEQEALVGEKGGRRLSAGEVEQAGLDTYFPGEMVGTVLGGNRHDAWWFVVEESNMRE